MYTGSTEVGEITDKKARIIVLDWMRTGSKGGRASAGLRFSHLGADKKAELLQAAKDGRLSEMEKPECKISKPGGMGGWKWK